MTEEEKHTKKHREGKSDLDLLRVRDRTISSFLATGWTIAEDNPNSRQCILKREWTGGSYTLAAFLLLLYIIPGIIYITVKSSKKKIINY